MDRQRSDGWTLAGTVIGGGLLCLALYFGAYFASVEIRLENSHSDENVIAFDPSYQWVGDTGQFVFYPAHQVDRRLRPTAWRQHFSGGPEVPEFRLEKQIEALEAYRRTHPPADEPDSGDSDSPD